ncbi:hypothetical protein T12_15615 [Trichinella patagoniensis]|uniref:Uncharacterized protein n=1 Tax=Trichinella patagoniensis TaxID=990121 RepID=A0A0V1A248_9BILA|nr:hypothetical protein T12_15615 [Trichinella patagoniensis]
MSAATTRFIPPDDMQECDYIRLPFLVATNKVTDHKRDIL